MRHLLFAHFHDYGFSRVALLPELSVRTFLANKKEALFVKDFDN
jgi:hypothetical protein